MLDSFFSEARKKSEGIIVDAEAHKALHYYLKIKMCGPRLGLGLLWGFLAAIIIIAALGPTIVNNGIEDAVKKGATLDCDNLPKTYLTPTATTMTVNFFNISNLNDVVFNGAKVCV